MPKYSFEFKKKVVEAYLRGEGGYSYLAKKYVELLVLHTLLVQILIHALCAPSVVLGDNGNVHRILTFKNHIVVGCLRLQLCDLLCLYCDRFLKCLPLFALGLQCLEAAMARSGFAISSSVAYIPCLRIAGSTSDVTQRLNLFAAGSWLLRIRL